MVGFERIREGIPGIITGNHSRELSLEVTGNHRESLGILGNPHRESSPGIPAEDPGGQSRWKGGEGWPRGTLRVMVALGTREMVPNLHPGNPPPPPHPRSRRTPQGTPKSGRIPKPPDSS